MGSKRWNMDFDPRWQKHYTASPLMGHEWMKSCGLWKPLEYTDVTVLLVDKDLNYASFEEIFLKTANGNGWTVTMKGCKWTATILRYTLALLWCSTNVCQECILNSIRPLIVSSTASTRKDGTIYLWQVLTSRSIYTYRETHIMNNFSFIVIYQVSKGL